MQPPDSSTGKPAALRQRVDLDGGYTARAVRRNGHQSPEPEAADPIVDELSEFLHWPCTVQRVFSVSSEDNTTVAGDTNKSREEKGSHKCRISEVPSYASGAASDGQREKCFVVSETSYSCKRRWRGERSVAGSNEKVASQSSYNKDDSGTDLYKLSSRFVGALYSLAELDIAYERASEALNQEKKREDTISTVIAEHWWKVSQLTKRFNSVVTVPLCKIITHNGKFRRSAVFSEEFEKKLITIQSYISQVCNEAERQENRNPPVIQVQRSQPEINCAKLTVDDTSDKENTMRETSYTVPQAAISAQKLMNTVVHQEKVMSKLCDIAEQFVCKTEISCKLILNCLKSIVKLVTPAVITFMVNEKLMRALGSNSESLPALRDASSVTARWTLDALVYAERAMNLHRDACGALHIARGDLNIMRACRLRATRVAIDVTAAGDRLIDLARQSNVRLAQIRNVESKLKMMGLRIPDVRQFGIVIEEWSATSSDTVTTVIQTLSLASQSSCRAIAGAVKAAEDIFIPVAVSLKEKNRSSS